MQIGCWVRLLRLMTDPDSSLRPLKPMSESAAAWRVLNLRSALRRLRLSLAQ
jgi:hypothetical protein